MEEKIICIIIFGSFNCAILPRQDMCHVVGVLSRFMQAPRKIHLDVKQGVLHYAKNTMLNSRICYAHGMDIDFFGYKDINWAWCL